MTDHEDIKETEKNTQKEFIQIYEARVKLKENEDSIRMSWAGEFVIRLTPFYILLLDITCSKTITTWYYEHIRKFGSSKHSVIICSGRRAETGVGYFEFETEEAPLVVHAWISFNQQRQKALGLKKKTDSAICHSTEVHAQVPVVQDTSINGKIGDWSVDAVCEFIKSIPDCSQYVEKFREERIDGKALLETDKRDLKEILGIPFGLAVRICSVTKAKNESTQS